MSSSMVYVYKAVKQEMSAEEVEGVELGQYSGEGSLCWLGLTEPSPLGATPGARRGRPRGRGAGRSGLARWNSSMRDGSKMSRVATHDLSSGP